MAEGSGPIRGNMSPAATLYVIIIRPSKVGGEIDEVVVEIVFVNVVDEVVVGIVVVNVFLR